MSHWPRVLGLFALAYSLSVNAQMWWQKEEPNRDFVEKPPPVAMDPTQVVLPPYPKAEDLVEFQVGASIRNKVYVDTTSISLGDDQIVRYVLLVKTPEGTRNVSYEGIRCSPLERLVYAYGQADGSWYRSRNPKWARVGRDETHPYYRDLGKDVLCDTGVPAGSGADIAAALKKAAPRR